MSHHDNEKVPPGEPAELHTEVPHSGAGAITALFAMLKKRQMRAPRDVESDVQPAPTPAPDTTGD